jgi:(1->4)-alpha-D-glucan 1-alpha-D-glucosylmutase
VDTSNAKVFETLYSRFIQHRIDFQDVACEKKKLVMQVAMSSEINTLGHYLNRISEQNRHTRDFTLNSLIKSIVEVIAYFPVYRTYINSFEVPERDCQYIESTISRAKRQNPAISASIFDFIRDVLLLRFPDNMTSEDKPAWLDFVKRFQQITGPVMAKGVEDTAFYVYNRLVSLNEVGGSPERFGITLEAFHGQNIERCKSRPLAMLATSTHDTKRSEDVRARINVLSEIPAIWSQAVVRWRQLNRKHLRMVEGQRAPSANEEYFFYQTLIGAWPATAMDEADYGIFVERIRAYMLKALREAKVNSSWINPDTAYEEAMLAFVDAVMDRTSQNRFLGDFISLQQRISHYGMFNSLSQTLLKITSPGVPDFYQGTELWDFSLVDPDNRRLVDYCLRMEMLGEIKRMEAQLGRKELVRGLTTDKEDGRIKLYLTYRLLNFRRENRELFEKGEYLPLEVRGRLAENVCAFARRGQGKSLIIAAPRFVSKIVPWPELPLGEKVWPETSLLIPFARAGARYRQVLTGESVTALDFEGNTILPLAEVFADCPVAALEADEG